MATAKGMLSKAGYRREALVYAGTWPSAVPIVVTALLPFVSESMDEQFLKEQNNTVENGDARLPADIVGRVSSGAMRFQPRYEGLEFLLCAALGFQAGRISGNLMPEELAVGAYRHLFELDAGLHANEWNAGDGWLAGDGILAGQRKVRRGTLAVDKQVSVWEFLSTMVNSLTITGTPTEMRISANFVGHSRDLASAINTSGVFDALSPGTTPTLLFSDMVIRLDDFSDSVSLSSADELGITEFEITIENNLVAGSRGPDSGLFIQEPVRDTKPNIRGSFTLPRHTSDTWIDKLVADNILMADIKFTGGQIAATGQNYAFNIYLSSLVFDTTPVEIAGPGVPPARHSFTCYKPALVPSGFPVSVLNGPVMFEVQSAESLHVLA